MTSERPPTVKLIAHPEAIDRIGIDDPKRDVYWNGVVVGWLLGVGVTMVCVLAALWL